MSAPASYCERTALQTIWRSAATNRRLPPTILRTPTRASSVLQGEPNDPRAGAQRPPDSRAHRDSRRRVVQPRVFRETRRCPRRNATLSEGTVTALSEPESATRTGGPAYSDSHQPLRAAHVAASPRACRSSRPVTATYVVPTAAHPPTRPGALRRPKNPTQNRKLKKAGNVQKSKRPHLLA
jgi:hypothetical protein